jgi:hypothetical protein
MKLDETLLADIFVENRLKKFHQRQSLDASKVNDEEVEDDMKEIVSNSQLLVSEE